MQGSLYLSVHGAFFLNRKSYGPVRCDFKKAEILRCGSVRFSDIVNPTVRFGAVIYPTVRFGAVLENRKCYGTVRCFHVSYGAVRCGFQKSGILRCSSVRFGTCKSQSLYNTTAVDCRWCKEPYNNNTKIESYKLRDRTEAWDDRRSGERARAGGRAGRRLVTGVRSGWGRASHSMRTKYHTCQ